MHEYNFIDKNYTPDGERIGGNVKKEVVHQGRD